ncbi:MAG: GNAT family N-acetyltransferase [Ruminococcus flavefaciens]|nr:GNAT family N-acetyltransferase [Ruminococcus flavefaciens]MCM1230455.1 GNAT family N-acetyltransferase [Ruminococcus flavefaciens]
MGFRVRKYKNDRKIRREIKRIYESAFPADEKAPFFLIMRKAELKRAEFLVAYENGEVIGFAYTVCHRDMAYLFYLAVDENKRGRGYGRKIIEAVKVRYAGKRIFLAREQLEKSAPNYSQRVSRRNFYLKCGFRDLPCCIKEASVVYDVMGIGGRISAKDYDELITFWAGKFLRKIVDMRVIEK